VTVSFRVPKELKKRMDKFKDINWSEEVRRFLEQRVRELEQLRAIEELERIIEKIPKVPSGKAVEYVREDRDSG